MDFIKDQSGRHLLRLPEEVPDYVKEAAVSVDAVSDLATHQFADTVNREFPVDNAGHVFLSYGYCKSAGVTQARILDRIKRAGAIFGITKDLEAIDLHFDSQTKSASEKQERQYAVELDFGAGDETSTNPLVKAGGVRKFYPINTPMEIETSAVKLANERSRLPLEIFVTGCRNIVKAASATKVSFNHLPTTVLRYGADRMPDFDIVQFEAEQRHKLTGDDRYMELAKSAAENDEKVDMDSYVELWRDLDAQNGVPTDKSVPDPYSIFNSGISKEAYEKQLNSMTVLADAAVPVAEIAGIEETTLQKHFSKEAAEQIAGVVKVANTGSGPDTTAAIDSLPEALQKAFLKLLLQS